MGAPPVITSSAEAGSAKAGKPESGEDSKLSAVQLVEENWQTALVENEVGLLLLLCAGFAAFVLLFLLFGSPALENESTRV
jgi:hypothetical protein